MSYSQHFGASSWAPTATVTTDYRQVFEWMNTRIYVAPVKQKSSEGLAAK